MASKVVSLSVHKNTKIRREKKDLRRDMINAASGMGSAEDIAGYVLIGIGRKGKAYASFDTGRAIPLWSVPGFVSAAVTTMVNDYFSENDGEDDFVSDANAD